MSPTYQPNTHWVVFTTGYITTYLRNYLNMDYRRLVWSLCEVVGVSPGDLLTGTVVTF